MSMGRGEGVALHPTLGYFYSWERRWWTWTRGLETFLRQLTKAVKREPELRRSQIPRSSSFKCVTGSEPRRALFPRKEFPWFCPNRQIKSPSKVLVTHWCGKLKQMLRTQKHVQPCWRTQLQGVKARHWDTESASDMQTFCLHWHKTSGKDPAKQRWWICTDLYQMKMGLLKINSRWAVWSCPEAVCQFLSFSLSIPCCQNALKWRFTGSTEWFPQEESFHTCLPNKQSGSV